MGMWTQFVAMTMVCLTTAASTAHGAEWPTRSVKFIVPSPPGGSIDVTARLYGERLATGWNHPVMVENRPGADGILAVQALMGAKDGHTFLLGFPGLVTVVPLLHERLPYNPDRDLEPISSVAQDFLAIAVTNALSAKSLSELVALARAKSQDLNWAASPGAPYLTFLEFRRRAGLTLTAVPYRSGASALPDLVNGQVHIGVLPLASALPQARSGKLRLLAVTAAERVPAAPDIPTATESGYPELTVEAALGLFAPAGTPAPLKERIASEVRLIAATEDVAARLLSLGIVARGSTPSEYTRTLHEQRARWTEFAKK